MPKGPNGEFRPADPIASAWITMRIATGEFTEREAKLEYLISQYENAIFVLKYDADKLDRLAQAVEDEAKHIGYTNHLRLAEIHTAAEQRAESEERKEND